MSYSNSVLPTFTFASSPAERFCEYLVQDRCPPEVLEGLYMFWAALGAQRWLARIPHVSHRLALSLLCLLVYVCSQKAITARSNYLYKLMPMDNQVNPRVREDSMNRVFGFLAAMSINLLFILTVGSQWVLMKFAYRSLETRQVDNVTVSAILSMTLYAVIAIVPRVFFF